MPGSRIYNPFVNGTSGGGGGADPNSEEVKTFPFSYNSSSPLNCFTLPAGARVYEARIIIETPFNDVAANLKIGDSVVDDRLLQTSQVDPTQSGEHVASNYYRYVADTNILLTIAPGSSTQGAGVVVVSYNLNT